MNKVAVVVLGLAIVPLLFPLVLPMAQGVERLNKLDAAKKADDMRAAGISVITGGIVSYMVTRNYWNLLAILLGSGLYFWGVTMEPTA